MLVDLYRKVSPQLTIMDGIVAMQGNGPQNGDAKQVGLVLASEDAVALDAVICEIVGLRKERMPTLLAAEQMGVGQTNLKNITIAGERLEDSRVGGFVFPETRDVMNLFPKMFRHYLRDWLTTRPLLDKTKCELCLICLKNCPASVISELDDSLVFDLKKCIRCFCCQEMCPQGAITVGSGPLAKILRL
jgi:ferredoxin